MGFRIAIDDFGRGESNFDRIWRIEPHIVKLDRSMLLHAERNEKARGVLKGLVHLLRQNGSLVVLEGIETEAQAEVALDSEADMFQGFYFGKPQSRPIATSEVKPRLSAIESRYRQLQYMRDEQSDLLLKSLRLEILNACDELARGADIHEACGSLLLIPAVKRCFILDHSGKQLTETVCSSLNVSLGDRMFNPLMDAEGACWRHREYFQRALSKPNQINISKPYIALPDAETTVTFSISTYTQQCHIVFCVDTSPEALKQDCQSLPMSLVGY